MAQDTIFQHWIFTQFILPFLLVWTIVFAILQKTKILGEKKQLDSIVAFVIGLIFVGVAYPKLVVTNLILFLTLAVIIVFVVMVLWGFLVGEKGANVMNAPKGVKWAIAIVILIAVILAVLWATGVGFGFIEDLIGNNKSFWTNVLFIVVIAAALAVVLAKTK